MICNVTQDKSKGLHIAQVANVLCCSHRCIRLCMYHESTTITSFSTIKMRNMVQQRHPMIKGQIKWSTNISISWSDHLPIRVLYLAGWEDVRILRAAAPKTSKLPQPDEAQHNSKVLKTETQGRTGTGLQIHSNYTGVLAQIVAILSWWQKMSFLIYPIP